MMDYIVTLSRDIPRYTEMCENMHKRFLAEVNFEKEAEDIKQFLNKLT